MAAELAFRDPDVVIHPIRESAAGRGLILRHTADPTTVVLAERAGIRLDRHDVVTSWSWLRVFARATGAVSAEVMDAAVWGQGSLPITTTPAAAAALAVAEVLAMTSVYGLNVRVINRLEAEGEAGTAYMNATPQFRTALDAAREEFNESVSVGGWVSPFRWTFVGFYGTFVAVVDSTEGVLHTAEEAVVLPTGVGVDGRKAIRSAAMRLVERKF